MVQLKDIDLLSIQEARLLLKSGEQAGLGLAQLDQKQIDAIVEAMAGAVRESAEELARLAVEETGRGKVSDKTIKNLFASTDVYRYILSLKTCGVIAENKDKNVIDIGVPVGLIAAIVPTTNPTSTTIFKILAAIKGRNPIVISPHPQAVKCTVETARIMNEAAIKAGAPEHSIGWMETVTLEGTAELMRHKRTRMILATGGPGLVKAAYSSGKPAFGVGPGNVPAFIEKTADVEKAVKDVIAGKTFDNGLLCSSEQALICDAPVEQEILKELELNKAYIVTEKERALLEKVVVTPEGRLNSDVVGRSPQKISEMAGFSIESDIVCLVVRLQGVGREHPLSMEKLSPILALYVEDGWEAACQRCIDILSFGGLGHTMSIHSNDQEIIMEFGLHKPAYRVCVNTPSTHGSIGLTTGVPPSLTLGCGTPGGNITSDNITPLHLINVRRLAFETRPLTSLSFEQAEEIDPKSSEVKHESSEERQVNEGDLRETVRSVVEAYVKEKGSISDPTDLRVNSVDDRPSQVRFGQPDWGPPTDFVCEDDVRNALASGRKIVIDKKTIITPAGRDAADGKDLFISG